MLGIYANINNKVVRMHHEPDESMTRASPISKVNGDRTLHGKCLLRFSTNQSPISSSLCRTRESSISLVNEAQRVKSGELRVNDVTGKWGLSPAINSCDQYVTASSRFMLLADKSFASCSEDASRKDDLDIFMAQLFAAVAVDSGVSLGESFCCRRISSRSFCIIIWASSRHFWVLWIDRGPTTSFLSDDAMAFEFTFTSCWTLQWEWEKSRRV